MATEALIQRLERQVIAAALQTPVLPTLRGHHASFHHAGSFFPPLPRLIVSTTAAATQIAL